MRKRKNKLPRSIRKNQEYAKAFSDGIKAGLDETITINDFEKQTTNTRWKMPRGFLNCRYM